MSTHAAAGGQPPAGARPRQRGQEAVVSLEWVLALPLLALVVVGLLEVGGVVRDVLLLHDAARAGARAAATSTGTGAVREAVDASAGALEPHVEVVPRDRSAGELVEVTVTVERDLGPVTHLLTARAVARVEPAITPGPAGIPDPAGDEP
jgi:Flp pilus assembly protein TadG